MPTQPTEQELLDATRFVDAPPPGYVRREGLIFEIGDYPTHNFSLTETEADRAINTFRPVLADLEHKPTLLQGKLGVMRRIWRDGRAIFGTADIPEWIDENLSARTVSCAWDRAAKTLKGFGWVIDPAVSEAALMGAYAQFAKTYDEGATVNTPGQTGANVAATTLVAYDTPKKIKERRFMPLLDKIKGHLATFNQQQPAPTTTTAPAAPVAPTTPAPQAPSAPIQPATAPTTPDPTTTTPAPTTPATGQPSAPAGTTPGVNFTAPGVEAMDEATADFRAQQIVARAAELTDRLIAEGHLHEFGKNALMAAFTAAGFDNEQNGPSLVTFSKADGAVVNDRVQLILEALQATPTHTLYRKSMPVNVYSGDAPGSTVKTAKQQGEEQAAEFNATLGGYTADPNTAHMNGNGTHATR